MWLSGTGVALSWSNNDMTRLASRVKSMKETFAMETTSRVIELIKKLVESLHNVTTMLFWRET